MNADPHTLPPNILRAMPDVERARYAPAMVPPSAIAHAAGNRNRAGETHKSVVAQIVGWLAQEPRRVLANVNRQDRKSTCIAGWPDITCSHPRTDDVDGIPTAFEVKVGDDRLSEDQIRVIEQMKRNGWRVYVVGCLDDVISAWATP